MSHGIFSSNLLPEVKLFQGLAVLRLAGFHTDNVQRHQHETNIHDVLESLPVGGPGKGFVCF